MKILLITHIYPPAVDGGSRVIFQLGQYFHRHHHQLLVLTTDCRSIDDFVNPNSVSVSNCGLPVYKHLYRLLKPFPLLRKGPIFKLIPFLKKLISIINFHPDFIIAGPLPTTIVLYAVFIKKLTAAKLLINASFHPTDPAFSQKPLISALRSADYLWTLTDYETKILHSKFQLPTSKMINVGNGVNASFLISHSPTFPQNPNLLYVGAFAQHKNIESLIDLFCSLAPRYPTLTLTLTGQSTLYLPQIKKHLSALSPSLRSKINFCLNFSDQKLISLYDSCTILCQPSSQESFGLTLIEAWARKKPVCVSRIPPFSELISKSSGGVFLDQITDLLNHPPLCRHLGQNGFRFVKKYYTWDKIGDSLWSKISS